MDEKELIQHQIGQASVEAVIKSIEITSLVNLLEKKGIFTHDEYLSVKSIISDVFINEAVAQGVFDDKLVEIIKDRLNK